MKNTNKTNTTTSTDNTISSVVTHIVNTANRGNIRNGSSLSSLWILSKNVVKGSIIGANTTVRAVAQIADYVDEIGQASSIYRTIDQTNTLNVLGNDVYVEIKTAISNDGKAISDRFKSTREADTTTVL